MSHREMAKGEREKNPLKEKMMMWVKKDKQNVLKNNKNNTG